VDEELFDRVQARLENRPKSGSRRQREYPLSGAMNCADCGRHLHGRASGSGVTRYRLADGTVRESRKRSSVRYYACEVCDYRVNAAFVETQFFESITALSASDALLKKWVNAPRIKSSDAKDLRRECKRLEMDLLPETLAKAKDRLFDLAVGASISDIDFRRQLGRLETETEAKRLRHTELSSALANDDIATKNIEHAKYLIGNFQSIYATAEYAQKRLLIEALVDALGGLAVRKIGISWGSKDALAKRQARSASVSVKHALNSKTLM